MAEERLDMLDADYRDEESETGSETEEDEDFSDHEMDMDEDEGRSIVLDGSMHFYSPDEVPNDGNCFFQSLVNLGLGPSVAALRQLAHSRGGQGNIDQDGIWANEQDITAVANALGIRIRVVSLDLAYKLQQDKTYGHGGAVHFLAHIFGGHFVPLRG
jgi:hypothetical protein